MWTLHATQSYEISGNKVILGDHNIVQGTTCEMFGNFAYYTPATKQHLWLNDTFLELLSLQ